MRSHLLFSRRQALSVAAGSTASLLLAPGVFADQLTVTPQMGEGPFYPDKLPLDTDNDLLILNDSTNPAVGQVTYLSGQVLTKAGSPIRNAYVEIWQCDNGGAYLHSRSANASERDSHFQGYGRFLTDSKGRYSFRTIKPVPYPGRTPHIHIAVSQNGRRLFTSQILIKGHKQNERDGLFRQIRDPKLREAVMAEFKPIPDSKIGELAADFNVVMGVTPQENEDGTVTGGVARPNRETRRRR